MHCRIYLQHELSAHAVVRIDVEQARYLRQVMRLRVGDVISVFNGQGGEYNAELTLLTKDGGECCLGELIAVNRELACAVHVIQAANKSDKIETVLQKATELGAASFQVVNSERAMLKLPAHKQQTRLQRWQKIVIEAAEQSERTAMPQVHWRGTLDDVQSNGSCFVLHPRDAMAWLEVRKDIAGMSDMTIAVGPEGGWTDNDLACLEKKGFQTLTFGERIMRTETAAPALLAAVQAVL